MATPTESKQEMSWPFGKKNYLYFAAGMVSIILGYITLANTAVDPNPDEGGAGQLFLTLSPLLLVLGYCVLIPISIIVDGRKSDNKGQES
ncbi:MAG TPA: hypothetical protein VLB27_05360 [candidate division Zixibacteria bacterium]|nr:hypothetical protein [candidate division Zixibacteria bacterium]